MRSSVLAGAGAGPKTNRHKILRSFGRWRIGHARGSAPPSERSNRDREKEPQVEIASPAAHTMPRSTMIDEASLPKPGCVQITVGEEGFAGSIFETVPPPKPTTIAPSS